MLRKRAAGARGANYNKLSPAQKMNIDRQIEPRTKNIKAMATRLMPRVKAGEMKRLNAVRTHKSTKGVYGNVQNLTQSYEPVLYSKLLGERVTSEDLNAMFSMYEGFVSNALAPVRLATKIAGGAVATAAALQTPQSTAGALGAAALYGYNKLANLGYDPDKKDKKKKDQADKHSDKMKASQQKLAQQALIQSKEKSKQAQLLTKKMQQKPRTNTSIAPSPVRNTPVQQPAQAQQQTAAPVVSTVTSNPAQQQAIGQTRQQKQAAAAKAARQQMGLVNHREWDYETYLQEKAEEHLQKKAGKYGVSLKEVTDIFEQGLADYIDNDRTTPHQFAMQRVNSYLTVGEGIGAGFEGTKKLTDKYKKVTPC
jgi:hypothetical protein